MPGYYHPTFLYESLWCVGVALLVIWADRRFKLGHGRAFALYVAAYCAGRFWIEYMRVDEAHHILGLRLNNWTALILFLAAVAYMIVSARLRPGREETVEPDLQSAEESATAEAGTDAEDEKPARERGSDDAQDTEDTRAAADASPDGQDGAADGGKDGAETVRKN